MFLPLHYFKPDSFDKLIKTKKNVSTELLIYKLNDSMIKRSFIIQFWNKIKTLIKNTSENTFFFSDDLNPNLKWPRIELLTQLHVKRIYLLLKLWNFTFRFATEKRFISICWPMTYFSKLFSYAFLVFSKFLILLKLTRTFNSHAEGWVFEPKLRKT